METIEDLYIELKRMLEEEDFANLRTFLKEETPKGYIEFVRDNGDLTGIEFKIGQAKFLIQAEIRLYHRYILYKTFQLIANTEDYPKIRLEHIPELDMFTYISTARAFKIEKTSEYPAKIGTNSVTTKKIEPNDIGQMYIQQVENWLQQTSESL